MLNVGDKAPNFSLFNTEKQKISLSDYKGQPVVVLFFPLAFTSVCTAELCTMRDDIAFYQNLNATIIGISVDSLFTLAKFKEEQKLNFDLLSDFNKEAAQEYGALFEQFVFDMAGVAKRAAFVVDKNGNLAYAEVLESAGDLPNFEAIKSALNSL